ncbi:glycerophosphodiester phosphodiesterase domain-containing protein 4 isoform X1 [Prionailurus viverrinus]|uniref:glycerophosphodiester phosphodiesterase domain-containing protein 4 isoform X1 n=2 Tax=Prionailurus viverrinus TaxID=61388 RepID=UPI001FF47A19|nr:glycerophosphodiester phosphodiesterase domain-containing protein 4 isoform X1 [Prionailurus viverrinus]
MLKKANRIEPGSQQERSLKKHNPWIICTCSRQCYITLITGCYTCEWQIKQEKKSRPGPCCCSWKEKIFFPFLIISFLLSVVLLFVWIETSNEYFGFDWVIFLGTGYWFFWSIVLLSLFGILTAYSSLLVVLAFLLVWEGYELYLHWCHKILILLMILLCSFVLWILCQLWQERWLTAGLSLQIFAPYMHLSGITVMVILSWPVAFYLIHLEEEVRMRRYKMMYDRETAKGCNILTKLRALQVAIGLPFFLILLCLYIVPLGIHSPCIQEEDKLGPKPDFFGHRGAPMLGPENTMMSFEKAIEQGAYGLESDVQLSYDQVPFLMHDNDLRRTTNIRNVQPNASITHSSFFLWSFLSTLNAGKWFVQSQFKPFYHMKPLSRADREKAENQRIPKLTDLLELAQKEKKFVIFDLNTPPRKHPLRHTYIRHVVRVILASKIEQHLIFWLPSFDRQYVQSRAPGFQQVGQLFSIERLTKENISRINVDYKRLFYKGLKDYKAANININLYIVNEPWLYSLAWCSRIHSVTTDNIQTLSQLNHPYFFMTPGYYMFMWLLMDSVSAVLIFAIFYFHWWRESKKEMFNNSIHTDLRSLSLQQREHGSQDSTNLPIKPSFRVLGNPWALSAFYPALTKSTKKQPGSCHFLVVPKKKSSEPEQVKETIKPLRPSKDDVRQPSPTKKTFEPTWDAPREATLETALPSLKVNKPIISSLEIAQSETESENTSTFESSQQYSFSVFSTISSMFSYELTSKKN